MSTQKHKPLSHYRESLRSKGWSLRTAAPVLGVHFSHVHHVLSGSRASLALLRRIDSLPTHTPTPSQP